jgi:ribosomal protein S18 acetylase RimI-like enzyme
MPSLSLLSRPDIRQIAQITALYRQAGWWDVDAPDDPELVARIVAGSHFFVIASHSDAIVGMGRAISDRASDGYLQDITVQKAYRKQGLGSRIIAMLIDRLQHDGIEWIGLLAEMKSYPVYEKLGFRRLAGGMPLVLQK